MTEAQLQRAVIDLAEILGWLVYHTYDSRHSAKGFPDLCMARSRAGKRGVRIIFTELKSATGNMSKDQEKWAAVLSTRGECWTSAEYYLWRPDDWSDGTIERILKVEKNADDE